MNSEIFEKERKLTEANNQSKKGLNSVCKTSIAS